MSQKREDDLDISKYSDPGEYREAAQARGIRVPRTFCNAVSSIMDKYDLTCVEACRLLELNECLTWKGKCPIIDPAHALFWLPQRPEIHCVCVALVIRNKALECKYTGGLEGFLKTYYTEHNADITAMVAMDAEDLDRAVDDIENSGLVYKEDFIVFDTAKEYRCLDGVNFYLGVRWLTGRYSCFVDGMFVSYHSSQAGS